MSFPNYSVAGILIDKLGRKCRTQKLKFFCEESTPQDKKEEIAKDVVGKAFCSGRNPDTIESITIAKLPPVKLGAKLNNQHDYMTLTANFLDGTLRFTTSYGGFKVSGDFVGNPLGSQLMKKWSVLEKQPGKKIGEKMEELRKLASESKTMEEFMGKFP